MKKIILTIIMIFLLTGCTNTVTFNFNDESIDSTIEMKFVEEEFIQYHETTSGHSSQHFDSNQSTTELIENTYNMIGIIALEKEDKFVYYDSVEHKQENTKHTFKFNYKYSYDNFKDNHYLNECFDFFSVSESDKYYHYKISGNCTCENLEKFELKIKSSNKKIESNSKKIEKDTHSWSIEKENNDITFSISKKDDVEEKKLISTTHIIGIFLILILVVLTFVYHKLTKQND